MTFSATQHDDKFTILFSELNIRAMMKESLFYKFLLIFFCNTVVLGYINSTFKSFGITFFDDDFFMVMVSSISAFFNGFGRIFWGQVMDLTSFSVRIHHIITFNIFQWYLEYFYIASVALKCFHKLQSICLRYSFIICCDLPGNIWLLWMLFMFN